MDGVELDDAKLRYIESIGTSAKVVICSKIAPDLTGFQVQIACHNHNFAVFTDTKCISHDFLLYQNLLYIAAIGICG